MSTTLLRWNVSFWVCFGLCILLNHEGEAVGALIFCAAMLVLFALKPKQP